MPCGGFSNALATISQNGVLLSYANGALTSTGSILNPTQVRAIQFGNAIGVIAGSNINFTNGQVWTKLDLAPTYVTSIPNDGNAKIIQIGSIVGGSGAPFPTA
jgi:hypothetical protein